MQISVENLKPKKIYILRALVSFCVHVCERESQKNCVFAVNHLELNKQLLLIIISDYKLNYSHSNARLTLMKQIITPYEFHFNFFFVAMLMNLNGKEH